MRLARNAWISDVLIAIGVYLVTALPVFLGLTIASTPGILASEGPPSSFLNGCIYFDGYYFWQIAESGYWFDPEKQCGIAFFPGYPVATRFVTGLTGWRTEVAMVIISNLALIAAFALISAYLRTRRPDASAAARATTLAAIGFWPAGMYFRVGYSESLFLAFIALLLLGLARRWPLLVLAVIAGAATGVRAVGVAGAGAVFVHILSDPSRGSLARRLLTVAVVAPICCWGLLAFMAFQYHQFDNPFAFAEVQRNWFHYQRPAGDTTPTWVKLVIAEPLWNTYIPNSPRYWGLLDYHHVAGLGQSFWNPIAFALAMVAVGFGWWRGWLNRTEAALGLGLLLIPYVTRAHEMNMASHARFVSVVIPAFLVFGRVLDRFHPAVSWAVFALMSPLLTVWAALFAGGWPMF
jgi:Mannosyltransferase (PIG-V)